MSLPQLLENYREKIPDWLTTTRVVTALVGAAIFAFGIWYYRDSYKADQIRELVRMNDELKEGISTLRKQCEAQRATRASRNAHEPVFVSFEPGQGFQKPFLDKKDLYIPRGAVFKARLITSIKTSIQESFVIAETTSSFEMDSKRRIQKGSRLIGGASLDRVLQGVVVKFDTLVTPKGVQYDDLALIALSENAYPMIDGIYFSDAASKYGTALAFGFLSGFASGGMEREPTLSGSVAKPSLMNQSLSGLSVASFKVAEEAMQSLHDENIEHVVVPAGSDIYVAFNRKWTIPDSEKGVAK